MQIGGALGSLVGAHRCGVSARERRILLVAGVAAGIAAVFRTPLGAALLAVEVLYRDDFESDALIPAVLASVVAYSVVISIFGESTLFAHAARYPFVPAHLPLYAAAGAARRAARRGVPRGAAQRAAGLGALPVPAWARPALGGLALGVFCVPMHHRRRRGASDQPGPGARHPRRRLRRRADGHHRRAVAAAAAGRGAGCCCFSAWRRSSRRRSPSARAAAPGTSRRRW